MHSLGILPPLVFMVSYLHNLCFRVYHEMQHYKKIQQIIDYSIISVIVANDSEFATQQVELHQQNDL